MSHKYLCEACEQAPASFICNADAASLCATCDEAIHSANPLSRRHHRVPVMPGGLGSVYGVEPRCGFLSQESSGFLDNDDEEEAASWLLLDAPVKNGLMFNGDEFLDLVEYNSCQDSRFSDDHECNDLRFDKGDADSVVPARFGEANYKKHQFNQNNFQKPKFELQMEYETGSNGYGFPAKLGHSISMSSLDVGVVPDSLTSKTRSPKGTIDLFSSYSVETPTQLTPIDRKARVQRYMEKKKTRKFEKTIRYASRKAYAETRPRIKGRFAKRANDEFKVDQMFSTTLMAEDGYCVVPFYK